MNIVCVSFGNVIYSSMVVNNINSYTVKQNNSSVAFQGLTKRLKKQVYFDGKYIRDIIKGREQKSLVVGSLPRFILEKLPQRNLKESIMEIYQALDKLVIDLRSYDASGLLELCELKKKRREATVTDFKKVLLKYNIISSSANFDIRHLGKGGKGSVYKFEGLVDESGFDEDEFIIKVFHVIDSTGPYKGHGCYAEINSAQYWMENVGKNSNRGKFFLGNLKTGYMICKYIDEDTRLPKRNVNPYSYGLVCTDEDIQHKHNVCKGYSLDWGGVRVINRIINADRYARAVVESIKKTPANERYLKWHKFFSKSRCANVESKNAGLALSIKYMDNKPYYIDTCLDLSCTKVNQALAYILKYLSSEDAERLFVKLIKTKDPNTIAILCESIPLLCMKPQSCSDNPQLVEKELSEIKLKKYKDIVKKEGIKI